MKRFVLAVLASALSLGVTAIPEVANADDRYNRRFYRHERSRYDERGDRPRYYERRDRPRYYREDRSRYDRGYYPRYSYPEYYPRRYDRRGYYSPRRSGFQLVVPLIIK
ncbi:hypothetical protein [Iningainema tapete]|uniref:Uncharacterized protein n=1 Tax=Iningainema tapete BLCC-T55 TaxID=2748662 RepID=A0A8J6XVY2_9CYAN|nr:hypothetical protein [Iningainema tapete]MBD2777247.1 hypothetical protein [Iningainema tapete BLCC-T55]